MPAHFLSLVREKATVTLNEIFLTTLLFFNSYVFFPDSPHKSILNTCNLYFFPKSYNMQNVYWNNWSLSVPLIVFWKHLECFTKTSGKLQPFYLEEYKNHILSSFYWRIIALQYCVGIFFMNWEKIQIKVNRIWFENDSLVMLVKIYSDGEKQITAEVFQEIQKFIKRKR